MLLVDYWQATSEALMFDNLKAIVNGASDLTIFLLVSIALLAIYVFVTVFKSDFSELD